MKRDEDFKPVYIYLIIVAGYILFVFGAIYFACCFVKHFFFGG